MQHGRGFSANCDGRDKHAGGAALGGEVTGKSAPSSTNQAANSPALVLHIIRDGRALAMSLEKLRYVPELFDGKLWFKRNSLIRTLRPSLTSGEIDATVLAGDHSPEGRNVL